jgi:hypothetical protein
MGIKLTNDEFIKKIKGVYGDKYNYSKVEYINAVTDVLMICPEHGDIYIKPKFINNRHLCYKCNGIVNNLDTFIYKSNNIHNSKYDYSTVEYLNAKTKVKIICPEHGEFEQLPFSHLKGHGCPNCSNNKKLTINDFIIKSSNKHNNKYDYSKVKYLNNSTNVVIICPEHGEFEQLPTHHLSGNGCPKCGQLKSIEPLKKDTKQFILESKMVHGEKYDYSLVVYTHIKDKVKIICPEHGEFEQTPDSHLRGCGCPNCSNVISKSENEIKDFITSLNIPFISNDRKLIYPLEIDIYIQDHNLAIEFDGLYWHSELHKPNNYHVNKTELCQKQGVQLIHIFEDEWLFKKDIVKSRLKNILGLTRDKIYGRKCIIKEVPIKDRDIFLNNNHIQGTVRASINLGLYYNDELVSLMTFNKPRLGIGTSFDGYELSRFCNKLDTNVVGGASKLLKYFIKHYRPNEIVSYADRRWSNGNLYETLEFNKLNVNKPNYSYIINMSRKHRFNFRKSFLKKDGFDTKNKTEHKIMLERGIFRIYDCGTITYKKSL